MDPDRGGWLTDEGLATVWEQLHRLVRSGRFDDAPSLLRIVVRRAYAGEAAAAQTGFGAPTLGVDFGVGTQQHRRPVPARPDFGRGAEISATTG